jgi:hypothetical protein
MKAFKLSLFTILIFISGLLSSQSISVSPAATTVEPCGDQISIELTLTIPSGSIDSTIVAIGLREELDFEGNQLLLGSGNLDSTVIVGDSVFFYLDSIVSGDKLVFDLLSTCEVIAASNYNFDQVFSTNYYTQGVMQTVSTNTTFTVASPYLVLDSRVENITGNPNVGDTIIRTISIKNTGSVSFTGAFYYQVSADKYSPIQGVGYSSPKVSNVSLSGDTASYLIDANISSLLTNEEILFYDTVVVKSCSIDRDSAKTYYQFNYGCNALDLCKAVGIETIIYSDILDLRPQIQFLSLTKDTSCFLTKDTIHYSYGITNNSSFPAVEMVLELKKLFAITKHSSGRNDPR